MDIDTKDRYRGCLLGLAAGDAVGTTLEFKPPGSFKPIRDMVGGGPFDLAPGQWTDDTSMALCLAESLVVTRGFNPLDQMARYVRWYRYGHLSCTGRCFDIGNTILEALHRFEATGNPLSGLDHPFSAGNGSLMRLAPVPMVYALRPAVAIEKAALSSQTTHATRVAIDACRYFAGLIVGALAGLKKGELLAAGFCPAPGGWNGLPLTEQIAEISSGSFKFKQPPDISGDGYVVHTLEAALWAFYKSDSFRQGCLMVANLGDDADTTSAIFGQLAGAYYGLQGIPEDWRERIALRNTILQFADRLYRLSRAVEVLDNQALLP